MPRKSQLEERKRSIPERLFNKTLRTFRQVQSDHIDWSNKLVLPPIRNQNRPNNTCVSYAVATVIETAFKMKFGQEVELCPEWMHKIIQKADKLENTTFLANMLFELSKRRENKLLLPTRTDVGNNFNSYVEPHSTIGIEVPPTTHTRDLLKSLEHGPVAVSMAIGPKFENWNDNKIYDGSDADGNAHTICIIGYNWPERYWIAQNSYGSNWGASGKVKIKMFSCQIEDRWSLLVSKDYLTNSNDQALVG